MLIPFFISALSIFFLRLIDVTIYSMRLMMVVRGRTVIAGLLAFCQSLVFVLAVRAVLSDLGNWGKVIGYSAGFATGIVIGMWLDERLALGFVHLRIISPRRGVELSEHLRDEGYGVTEISAQGQDGKVEILHCYVARRDVKQVERLVSGIDPEAFITAENVRSVLRGYWKKRNIRKILP